MAGRAERCVAVVDVAVKVDAVVCEDYGESDECCDQGCGDELHGSLVSVVVDCAGPDDDDDERVGGVAVAEQVQKELQEGLHLNSTK